MINLGGKVNIDLVTLLETRMLVQANSGGGKSYLLRRLLEQTAGKVQQIVIDPEGEFATLRERHDYIIAAAHDADAVATPHTAKLLATKLLETGVSAIVDIYDLKAHERQAFVKLFIDAMVNAPKRLWHPVLVVLDEAHVFCPQGSKSESLGSVIDMATRGRKRGMCLIAATQRLAKLHKDVAAELLNKLIGRTGLDIDVKRVADEMGMTASEARDTFRMLEPGVFHCYGPAISNVIVSCKVGPVLTTHPKSGQRLMTEPPAPSPAIKKVLASLADLPKESQQEARTLDDMRRQITELRRSLTIANRRVDESGIPESEVKVRIAAAINETRQKTSQAQPASDSETRGALIKIRGIIDKTLGDTEKQQRPRASEAVPTAKKVELSGTSGRLTGPQQKIVNAIGYLNALGIEHPDRIQVCAVSGYKQGGAFNNYLGNMRTVGVLDYPANGCVCLTEYGKTLAVVPNIDGVDKNQAIQDAWFGILSGPHAKILKVVVDKYPEDITRDQLAVETGYQIGGAFNNYVGRLRTLGTVSYSGQGRVRASDLLFPSGAQN